VWVDAECVVFDWSALNWVDIGKVVDMKGIFWHVMACYLDADADFCGNGFDKGQCFIRNGLNDCDCPSCLMVLF
jgi:hypothetical protein